MATNNRTTQQNLGEILQLIKDYAIQETVDPIKGLSKFVGFGVAAAIVGSLATVLITLGILRMIQMETAPHLAGHLSWVPYLITLLLSLALIGLAVASISSRKGKAK